jgi:hypothetical protein
MKRDRFPFRENPSSSILGSRQVQGLRQVKTGIVSGMPTNRPKRVNTQEQASRD